jgi:putative ABC transport system permease protein
VGAVVLLMAGSISILIAALTVSYQSIRAALANPIQSLRIE